MANSIYDILNNCNADLEVSNYLVAKLKKHVKYIDKYFYVFDDVKNIWEKKESIKTYLGRYIKQELDAEIEKLEKKDTAKAQQLTKMKQSCLSQKRLRALQDLFTDDVVDIKFLDKVDANKDFLSFNNGIIELKTGKFRERKHYDYISETLEFDYKTADKKKVEEVKQLIYHICNDNDEDLDFMLSWLGYCMTGQTKEQKYMNFIGELAGNGKSTLALMFYTSLPIYSMIAKTEHFEKGAKNRNKTVAKWDKMIRFVAVEELENRVDIGFLKTLVNGKCEEEILYRSQTRTVSINLKVNLISNQLIKMKFDEGGNRRGMMVRFSNRFIDRDEYKGEKGTYPILNIEDMFNEGDEYKLAFIELLLPYAKKFYENGKRVSNKKKAFQLFRDTYFENDEFSQFLDSRYVRTKNKNDRVPKDVFTDTYNEKRSIKKDWFTLLSEINRVKIEYNKDIRSRGVRGCLVGIRERTEEDDIAEGIADDLEDKQEAMKNDLIGNKKEKSKKTKSQKESKSKETESQKKGDKIKTGLYIIGVNPFVEYKDQVEDDSCSDSSDDESILESVDFNVDIAKDIDNLTSDEEDEKQVGFRKTKIRVKKLAKKTTKKTIQKKKTIVQRKKKDDYETTSDEDSDSDSISLDF